MLHIPSLYIKPSKDKGRGVFTTEKINVGDIIEVCPIIIIEGEEVPLIHKTKLHDYYFLLPDDTSRAFIALGYGSIYNHRKTPNAEILVDIEAEEAEIHCTEPIEAGDEIFIYYNEDKELWFQPQGEQKI